MTLRSLRRGADADDEVSMGMDSGAPPVPRAAGEMVRDARAEVVQASTSMVAVEALERVCWWRGPVGPALTPALGPCPEPCCATWAEAEEEGGDGGEGAFSMAIGSVWLVSMRCDEIVESAGERGGDKLGDYTSRAN